MMPILVIGMHAVVKVSNQSATKQRGFTLIEILIVLVIIGIVASFAVLAVGDFGQSRRIETAAEELDLLIGLAQQQAILEPVVLGLVIQDQGYSFVSYHLDYEHLTGRWQKLTHDNILRYRDFPKNTAVNLKSLDDSRDLAAIYGSERPAIIISPSGDITPFIIELGKPNKAPLFRINAEASGKLTIVKL